MRALSVLPLLLCACLCADQSGDRPAIQKTITRFNDSRERSSTLTRDADIASLERFEGPGLSQVYFEAKEIRFVAADVAFVDAVASQYGSLVMKRSTAAHFVLRREAEGWRIAVMRVDYPMSTQPR